MTTDGWLRQLWLRPAGRVGVILLVVMSLTAAIGPAFLPDPLAQPDLAQGGLRPPDQIHLLGTDYHSRDVMARVVTGARVSLAVAFGAVLLSITLGGMVGLAAGYLGSWIDAALMRLVDAALAIPRLFLLLIMVASMERIPLWLLIVAIGATGWFGTSRLVRAEVRRLRAMDFVRSAEALGATRRRILARHLLPNVLGPLTVATTLAVGDVILLEAGLSFLGLGVQPPTPSWGGMIMENKSFLVTAPWTSLAPGLAIVIAVVAVNLIGESLHQDPALPLS